MEQTNNPHTPDQQTGPAEPRSTQPQPQRPGDPAATEGSNNIEPPAEDDTEFEPV